MTRTTRLRKYTIAAYIVVCALMLGGCVTDGATPQAVCKALLGPIQYTSANAKSDRFAGKKLAPDLAARNRVGINLACPGYRKW